MLHDIDTRADIPIAMQPPRGKIVIAINTLLIRWAPGFAVVSFDLFGLFFAYYDM